MQLVSSLTKLLSLDLNRSGNVIRDSWDLLAGVPGGKLMFAKILGRLAPYTGSIGATVTTLRAGYCQVQLEDRRAVRNHLHSVHAIALANLAEMAGNLALAYSLPDDGRFIVAGIDIKYVKKARGLIIATGESAIPATSVRAEYEVPVTMKDSSGAIVATAVLHTLVGPKPNAQHN